MSEAVIEKVDNDGMVRLTINRPKALNALNSEVLASLEMHLVELEAHPNLRGVLITGAGEKSLWRGLISPKCVIKRPNKRAPSPAKLCVPSNAWKRCPCRWSRW